MAPEGLKITGEVLKVYIYRSGNKVLRFLTDLGRFEDFENFEILGPGIWAWRHTVIPLRKIVDCGLSPKSAAKPPIKNPRETPGDIISGYLRIKYLSIWSIWRVCGFVENLATIWVFWGYFKPK